MHGAIDYQDPYVYKRIYNMAWDFKLLFFCLCECQTNLQTHQYVILNDTTYQVCTPNLVYKGQTISLWPFYLVLRSEENTHWFIPNITKSGLAKYLEIHTNVNRIGLLRRIRIVMFRKSAQNINEKTKEKILKIITKKNAKRIK